MFLPSADCGVPPDLPNSYHNYAETVENYIAHYTCKQLVEGLEDGMNITCQENGKWTEFPQLCLGENVDSPDLIVLHLML